MEVGYGGRGGHGHGDWELAESSAQAEIGRGVDWRWSRMVGRCSPRRETDQDGLGEEID